MSDYEPPGTNPPQAPLPPTSAYPPAPPPPTRSYRFPSEPPPPESPPKRKRRRWPWIVGGVVVVLLVAGAVAAGVSDDDTTTTGDERPVGTTDPAEPEPTGPTTTTTEPESVPPKPEDFAITLVVKSKQCFGSAGCNITYEPELAYNGLQVLDPEDTWDVIYSVNGGDSGPIIDTIEVTGDQYNWNEGFASTGSEGTELTAVVTEVRKVGL
jgi:hypothetical protein